ncbi:184_t:CDS:2 [Rhizophagus irregularis]|nr:184_t:CDS:2 [Rhizophagus irregularis]
MGDITKLARNEVDDLNYHFLQYCKCSVTTAKKLKSVASMDIVGVHLETLPTVRLSVKGEMGMEDTINDDGPYCVRDWIIKDTIFARSYDFEVFPAYLDVNTMDALVSLAGNANKNYNPDRTAYLGIPLWGSLAQAGVSLINLIHLSSQF